MKRSLMLLGFLVCAGILPQLHAQAPDRKPNIVLIVADDLGYGELGCQGNPQIPTPHIDSLARNGVRFTQGYVTSPFCSPSRAGLMTGRYQTRFGHELNAVGKQNLEEHIGLPLSEKTMADYLKNAGYATGLIGKWHLGGTDKFHPLRRGFDEFYGFLHEGHFFVPGPPYHGVTTFLRTNTLPEGRTRMAIGGITWHTLLKNNEPPYDANNPVMRGTETLTEPDYLTDAFTREALSFIDRHHRKPFFLYMPHLAVHSPMQATPKYMERFAHIEDLQRRVFAGMLAALDDSVGAVLGKLRALGLEENTLIFFISDNGGPTLELTSSNAPLRGGKGQLWEGGIRVPFLAQWKGHLPAGKVYEQPVISLDILPTSLAAAGVKLPTERPLDGVNLLPFLKGEKTGAPHEVLFWRYDSNIAIRQGDWKLVRQSERGAQNTGFQLFNLAEDIGETRDMSGQRPEVVEKLKSSLEKMNSQMVEPLWGGRR